MLENVGEYYIIDGSLKKASLYIKEEYNRRIYEVIRIIDQKPLFFDDHYKRFGKSAKLVNKKLPLNEEELKQSIKKLLTKENEKNCNLMIISYYNDEKSWYIIYVRRSYYPSKTKYIEGIETSMLQLERNTPNAKILKLEYKRIVSDKIKKDNVFEVILYNGNGIITEGSKSNIFFVKDNSIYTAPDNSVLEGVTRKYVFEGIKELNINVIKKEIRKKEIKNFDACFITGTSIGVLPVKRIEDIYLNSSENSIYKKIHSNYEMKIKKDIKSFKF